MKKIVQLFRNSLFLLSLFTSCTPDSLPSDSSDRVILRPSFHLSPIQAEVRNLQTFQPEEGSQFTIERTDDTTTPAAIYSIQNGNMVSDAPLLLPQNGNYPFRIYGKSGDVPVAFYDETTVDKEGKATFPLYIVCASIKVHLQAPDSSPIADGKAEITLPNLHGTGTFNTDFTIADETAITVDADIIPTGSNNEDILFHPQNTLTGGGELITISYEGKIYRYSPTSIPDFSAGKRYIYTLRLGTEMAELVTVDIADFKPFILTKESNNNLSGIYTEEDLIAFREAINQGTNIDEWSTNDVNNTPIINLYNDIELTQEWSPINSFKNSQFHGNGHTISNLKFQQTTGNTGFFIEMENVIIQDLNMTGININLNDEAPTSSATQRYCGILSAAAVSSTIQNVHIKDVEINGKSTGNATSLYIGGIAGTLQSNTQIKNISIEHAIINGTSQNNIYIGGLIGYTSKTATESVTLNDLQISGTCLGGSFVYAGGLSGRNAATSPTHKAVLNSIEITARATYYIYCGGMIGYNEKSDSPVSQSKLTNITLETSTTKLISNYLGGLIGYNMSPLENIELSSIKNTAKAANIYNKVKYIPYLCNGGAIGRNGGSLHRIHANKLEIKTVSAVEKDISFLGSGGLIGFCFSSNAPTLTQCSADQSSVEGYYAGGNIGYNYNGNIIGCSATNVDIKANLYSGGLIGFNYIGKNIFCCYSTGTVTTSGTDDYGYAGGLIGREGGNNIEQCYSRCNVINPTADNGDYSQSYAGSFLGGGGRSYSTSCYSTGTVNGSLDNYFIASSGIYENSEIRFCYTTQNEIVIRVRAPAQLGGSAGWNKTFPFPEDILRTKASITQNGITWKASSLWLAPEKGAHPVINMNYQGE